MLSGSEESNLVRAAAEGDGPAFARLYESYERRIFNYLLRLLGDHHEAEDATQEAFIKVVAKLPDLDLGNLEFGAYLYTAARNVGYDVISKRKRLEPTGAVPEQAEAPFRGELADLETDPERAALASSQEAAVQSANERLPERQREVLALRELDGMSYDEIAGVMEMKSNAVAQLISRARLSLRKEMRAGAAASVALATADCERAHGELALRQDDQSGVDSLWLDAHLVDCANCRVAGEEMAEAGVSYRAWAPVVPAAWLFREVMAKASEISGHDWSGIERPSQSGSGEGDAAGSDTSGSGRTVRRAVVAGVGSVLVAGMFAGLLLAEADAPERAGPVREELVREAKPVDVAAEKPDRKRVSVGAGKSRLVAPDDPQIETSDASASEPSRDSGGRNALNDGSGAQQGGGGDTGGSTGFKVTDEPADPVEPADPTTPEPTDPTPEPTPDPDPDPTPIPGGPGDIANPGDPTPG